MKHLKASAVQRRRPMVIAALALLLGALPALAATAPATQPPQVPLCMIGDSITWAGDGDYWRHYLLQELPRLAFVGTHTAKLGYSHAGEGGNSTGAVLRRLADLPDCPYYSLEIGTNNNNVKEAALIQPRAAKTAEQIIKIVNGLLAKPSVQKVFLGSVMPCKTKNPLRDQTNAATNVILRSKFDTAFPPGKVVWVEYEKPIRAIENWQPMIRLHPNKEGYKLIARILADTIVDALQIQDRKAAPNPAPGTGVRVDNLWADGQTRVPIIAGWYTVSFDVTKVTADRATVEVHSAGENVKPRLSKVRPVAATDAGRRLTASFFTNYEGRGRYTRSHLAITAKGCEIAKVLFEKTRPSGKASTYGKGSYVDTQTPAMPGELIERP